MKSTVQSNKNLNLLDKASQQLLYQELGYDSGKAYYFLLTKNFKDFEKEFSYSKRYRLLKELFNCGVIGKIKIESQESFNYFILPPLFLYSKEIDFDIITFLEKIYLKNYSDILLSSFSQVILKSENPLIFFLLKYFMKEEATLTLDKTILNKVLGDNLDKVNILKARTETKRRIGIIDKNFTFEFFDMLNKTSYESFGYIINHHQKCDQSKTDDIIKIKNELKGCCLA